ncbi:hypothetical protein BC940DRAFT_309290 [Gongronella butleri]|nr:hypothetical protein BC940DRAFT_309290 [Gongronella butleri]
MNSPWLKGMALVPMLWLAVTAMPLAKRTPADIHPTCTEPGSFAITIDDGPYNQTWDLVKYLNKQNVHATFFINGKNWVDVATQSTQTSDGTKTYMEHLQFMDESGHQIASHTFSHVNLVNITDEQVTSEMNQLSDLIYEAIKKRPRYMRPPTGLYDAASQAVIGNLGYEMVLWDVDSRDWETENATVNEQVFTQLFEQEGNTTRDDPPTAAHIGLMHDVHWQTAPELIPWLVPKLRDHGYKMMTVAECLNDNRPYQ